VAALLHLRTYLDWLIVSPAIPLAIYFSVSTMLGVVAPYAGVEHPAYWIFGYLGICVASQLRRVQPRTHPIDLLFLIFLAVIVFSWIRTGQTGGSRTLLLLLSNALIPWIAVRVFDEQDVARFIRWTAVFGITIAAAYLVAIPLLQHEARFERVPFMETEAYGVIGPTVGLLAVITAIYLMREKLPLGWGALPVCVIVIVHMGARGMLVSFIITLLLGCILVDADVKRKATVCAVVLAATVIALTLIPEARLHHFLRLAHDIKAPERSIDDTIAIRIQFYRQALELFLSAPLTGLGAGRFGLHTSLNLELTTPHSTVFHILSELGLLGAGPFAILNLLLLWLAYRARARTLSCVVAAGWAYFAVFDQISANYLSSLRYYLFSGLLVTACYPPCSKNPDTSTSH